MKNFDLLKDAQMYLRVHKLEKMIADYNPPPAVHRQMFRLFELVELRFPAQNDSGELLMYVMVQDNVETLVHAGVVTPS